MGDPSCRDLTLTTRVWAAPDQVSAHLKGEAVVLNLRDGVYYGLDAVGARVWQLLQQPRTIENLRDSIMAEYDVAAEQCAADLFALLHQLIGWDLVEAVGAGAGREIA